MFLFAALLLTVLAVCVSEGQIVDIKVSQTRKCSVDSLASLIVQTVLQSGAMPKSDDSFLSGIAWFLFFLFLSIPLIKI